MISLRWWTDTCQDLLAWVGEKLEQLVAEADCWCVLCCEAEELHQLHQLQCQLVIDSSTLSSHQDSPALQDNSILYGICLSSLSVFQLQDFFFTKNSSWLWQIPEGESRSDLGKPIKVSKEYQKALYPNPMNGSNTGWYLFVISFLIEHEYSICVSWSENPNPPRNLSFFWFLNKIGNQLSFQAVLTVCRRYVKPTNRKF